MAALKRHYPCHDPQEARPWRTNDGKLRAGDAMQSLSSSWQRRTEPLKILGKGEQNLSSFLATEIHRCSASRVVPGATVTRPAQEYIPALIRRPVARLPAAETAQNGSVARPSSSGQARFSCTVRSPRTSLPHWSPSPRT